MNKKLFILFAVIPISIFFTVSIIKCNHSRQVKKNTEINFVIQDFRYFEGHRGIPSYKVFGEWKVFEVNEYYLYSKVKVGDSLHKSSGEEYFEIYRKNKERAFVKIFDFRK